MVAPPADLRTVSARVGHSKRIHLSELEHGDLLPEGEDFEGRITSTAKEDSDGHKERKDDMEHEFILLTRRNVGSPGRRCEIASC
jgi:hypothetical protein